MFWSQISLRWHVPILGMKKIVSHFFDSMPNTFRLVSLQRDYGVCCHVGIYLFVCFWVMHLFSFSFQIIAFDELKTDYKNPIDQCNTLNPVSESIRAR